MNIIAKCEVLGGDIRRENLTASEISFVGKFLQFPFRKWFTPLHTLRPIYTLFPYFKTSILDIFAAPLLGENTTEATNVRKIIFMICGNEFRTHIYASIMTHSSRCIMSHKYILLSHIISSAFFFFRTPLRF